jgi:oligosaccharide translocation protein RFT1
MFAFSVIYISTAVFLYRLGWGDVSLIYANCVSLAARVAYCLAFSKRFFSSFPTAASENATATQNVGTTEKTQPTAQGGEFRLANGLPRLPFLIAVSASAVIIQLSSKRFNVASAVAKGGKYVLFQRDVLTHVVVGGALGVGCLAVWWVSSGKSVLETVRSQRGGRVKAD